ncbi:MAG: lipoate-protein ligase A [Bacteriovoracaceae bacterium]|jgi:lipoate-protein ligase A
MIYLSSIHDPYQNLAIEQALLTKIPSGEKWLFLYRNRPSIVMGRFQNPWLECDIGKIQKDGLDFVRRQSGGGTVYHDLNNVNFSFIQGKRDHDKDINNTIIIKALADLGIKSYASGRSDIMIDEDGPKKISGSAFKQKKDSSFHHGTMLIKTQLDKLNNFLTSKHEDIEGKGIKSVKSTVQNLSEIDSSITVDRYLTAIQNSFKSYIEVLDCQVQFVSEMDIDKEYLASIKNWSWMYGETPLFEIDRESDNMTLNLTARKGIIEKMEIYSNQFTPQLLNHVCEVFIGKRLKFSEFDGLMLEIKEQFSSDLEELNVIEKSILSYGLFI